jgi:hypothetical protein
VGGGPGIEEGGKGKKAKRRKGKEGFSIELFRYLFALSPFRLFALK